jgi:serine/threonine-protein kinase OSR1/STK39
MRQERRRRQPSVISHGTMDSWDFDATETNSSPPSIPSDSNQGGSRSVSPSENFDIELNHESPRPGVHPRFELPSRTNDIRKESVPIMCPVIGGPTSHPTSTDFQNLESEKQRGKHLLSGPLLPPLSSSSYSSESAQSRGGSSVTPRLDSSFREPPPAYKPGSPGVRAPQFAPRSVPTPIPIPKSRTSHFRKSSFSSPTDGASSSPPSISPGLWQRLTRTTSRSAIDEESPLREKKMSGFSRILNKRSSTSLSRRSVVS